MNEELDNNIRRLRFEHNEMTQQELADRVGASRQTIVALEKRKYVPSVLLAYRIAQTFNKTIEEVFLLNEGAGDTDRNK